MYGNRRRYDGAGLGVRLFPVGLCVNESHQLAHQPDTRRCPTTSSKVFRWNPILKYHLNHRVADGPEFILTFRRIYPLSATAVRVSSAEAWGLCTNSRPPRATSSSPWFNCNLQVLKKVALLHGSHLLPRNDLGRTGNGPYPQWVSSIHLT